MAKLGWQQEKLGTILPFPAKRPSPTRRKDILPSWLLFSLRRRSAILFFRGAKVCLRLLGIILVDSSSKDSLTRQSVLISTDQSLLSGTPVLSLHHHDHILSTGGPASTSPSYNPPSWLRSYFAAYIPKMSSGNRSFFAPQETRVDLPHGASQQTPDTTRPASPSENDRAPFLDGGDSSPREDVRMGAKARIDEKPAVGIMALAPILSYCAASITMTVVNKFTVSGAGFNMNLLVLLIQSTVGVTCVYAAERMGLIQLRGLNSKDAWNWMPLSTMLVFVIWTGSKALQYLNISVYTIFKNLTIILIAYGEVMWFGGRVTRIVLSSFLLMVLSSIIAAWSDISKVLALGNLSMPHTPDSISGGMIRNSSTGALVPVIDPLQAEKDAGNAQMAGASANDVLDGFRGYGVLSSGYLWMALNCICSATYVLLMRKRIKTTGFKDWDTMYYNNALSIPVLLVMSLLVEDWSSANLHKNFPDDKQTKLISAIVFSGACAILISYTTAWCIRATSSTTYSMVGALNKLPVALSGMVFFHDPEVTLSSVSAITVGFFAGLVYAFGKNKQAEAAKLAGSSANGSSLAGSKDGSALPMHNLNDRKD